MSAEELKALAEKLQAEAGRRGLERPRTIQRIIIEEGNEAAELAKVTNADHVIMRVIVKAARPDPAPDDAAPRTDEIGDEGPQEIRADFSRVIECPPKGGCLEYLAWR